MKILLLQDQSDVREKLVFAIESTFQSTVVEAATIKQALELLKDKKDPFDLIICDYQKGSLLEFEAFQAEIKDLACILCVNSQNNNQPQLSWNVLGVVDRGALITNVLSTLDQAVKKGSIQATESDDHFCKIRTKLLLSVCPLKGDIYIRLSESKYIKLFHQGDNFVMEDMQKYTIKKGVEYLYIRKEQTKEFIDKYRQDLEKLLNKASSLTVQEVAAINDSIYDTVQELGRRLGFTKDVQAIAKTHVRMTMKAMGKSPKLSELLSKLEGSSGLYIASHSTLCGYLACSIASHMEWGSDATFHKLNLAAFLHDITMENHELAEFQNVTDATKSGKFKPAEIEQFKKHPVKGAEIAKQFQEVPPDVDIIISQHHELPDGRGWPRQLTSAYISPLSCVFIVAHDLAKFYIRQGAQFKVRDFLEQNKEKYKPSQFRKVMAAIEALENPEPPKPSKSKTPAKPGTPATPPKVS